MPKGAVTGGVEGAAPALDAYLDAELARLDLPPENLALAGFSQGTMLSLHLGLRRKVKPAAIVGFSGLLPAPVPAGEIPPILLTHGDSDQVIPPQAMFLAASQLGRAGAAVLVDALDAHGLAVHSYAFCERQHRQIQQLADARAHHTRIAISGLTSGEYQINRAQFLERGSERDRRGVRVAVLKRRIGEQHAIVRAHRKAVFQGIA